MDNTNKSWRIITGPGVPIEQPARDQLCAVAAREDCLFAVGQPDLHAGPGQPIGACFAMSRIWPRLVGGDAGCGVRVAVARAKYKGDRLLRRVDDAFSEAVMHSEAVHLAAWHGGVRGLANVEELPSRVREQAAAEPIDGLPASGPPPALMGLDSIGGGNHFAEISEVSELAGGSAEGLAAEELADKLNLHRRATAVVVHSGSRGVGAALAADYGMRFADGATADDYLAQLAGAVRYAAANRFLLSMRLLRALGSSVPKATFDVVHNTVVPSIWRGQPVMLHRKGCAPADAGTPTVVLGSRGTPTWILRGEGNEELLSSVAHGAGRRLTRSDARARFRAKYRRSDLRKTKAGGVVLCERNELLFEEHPDAYKKIGPVVDALEEHGLARRVAALTPKITIKR